MINKYIELHNEFLDILVKYHNAHMVFRERPNAHNLTPVIRATMKMSKLVREMKKHNRALKPWLYKEKQKYFEEKNAKKEAKRNERLNRSNENSA